MKKVILMFAATIAAMFMLSGCDNKKLENSWDKAKVAHKVVKAVGKVAIEEGVVSDETADKLKKANSAVEGAGGLVEDVYSKVQTAKKQAVTGVTIEQKTIE